MDLSTGKLAFIFGVAVILAGLGAWIVAARYRAAMRTLMSAPVASAALPAPAHRAALARRDAAAVEASPDAAPHGSAPPGAAPTPGALPAAPLPTLAANRRAAWRLSALVVGIGMAIAFSSTALQLAFMDDGRLLSWNRLWLMATVRAWPILPLLAILWRWSALRLLGVAALFLVFCFALTMARSIEPQPGLVVRYLLLEIGPASLLIALLCLGSATRAIAPALLLPLVGLVWASIAGIDLLGWLVERRSPWLLSLELDPVVVMAGFALLPWLIAWWPLSALGRWLGRAYTRRVFSELSAQMTAVWGAVLVADALAAASGVGVRALALLVPLLWIPVGLALAGVRPGPAPAPILLVLRVFQRDATVSRLFDRAIGRWRLTGNTLLIAGTDLVDRTIDAGDVLNFLDRRLGERFVSSSADVAARIAEFELRPDREGRYRINECYCRNSTWREAFAALAALSDVVLMDLRGLQAKNAGSRHELESLARAPHAARVVVLVDAETDRAVVDAAAAGAPEGRFSWIESGGGGRLDHRRLLERLFASGAA